MGCNPAPRAPRNTIGRLRRRLAGERGVTLIETVIAAAILVVVVGAVLATLDTASSATASNRGRTVAAALAEQDQENLRAMRTQDLAALGARSKDHTVGNVKYTVVSEAKWIRDATSGEPNCTNSSRQSEYLQLTSTVTSNVVGKKIKPVQMRSLIAPRVGDGTLAVKVADQADAGLAGIPVNISGPGIASGVTNAQGCAVFGHIEPGTYTIRANAVNHVDPAGKSTAETSGNVTAGTVNVTTVRLARAASVTVNFETKVGATWQQARSVAATATNAGIPAPSVRAYTVAAPANAILATGLFPFTDGYSFYSGTCTSAKPTLYNASYYSSNPGVVTVGPGGSASVTVREPALNIRVTRATSSTNAPVWTGARVLIKSLDTDCSDRHEVVGGLTATGGLPEPGLPFGRYRVCADDSTVIGDNDDVHRTSVDVTLNNSAGSTQQNIFIDSNGSSPGRCT
jgi:Tfp pilus assembly protein PilV